MTHRWPTWPSLKITQFFGPKNRNIIVVNAESLSHNGYIVQILNIDAIILIKKNAISSMICVEVSYFFT